MANTFPRSRQTQPDNDHSLPCRLVHKQLDRTPFALKGFSKDNDRDYLPDQSQTQSHSSASESFEQESSFSHSSYDPLENMEEYLRMRDKL